MSKNNLPQGLYYNKDYSWLKLDGDVATLGVVGPAAERVQEFVFIKLPKTGQSIKAGDTYASVEAVKWSGHLSSPVSGEVVEVNEELFDEPSTINQDPYGEGWIAKIKMSNKKELENLAGTDEAEKWYGDK